MRFLIHLLSCVCLQLHVCLFSTAAVSQYVTIEKDGKVGLANEAGKIIIPLEYEGLGWSKGTLTAVGGVIGFKQNSKWGLIQLDNKKVTTAQFSELFPAKDNYILAAKKGRFSNRDFYGVIDSRGKSIVPFHYEMLQSGHDLLIAAYRKNRQTDFGLIDFRNKVKIPFEYYTLKPAHSNYYLATDYKGKKSLLNQTGQSVLSYPIDSLYAISETRAIVYSDGKSGLINESAQNMLPLSYKRIQALPSAQFNTLDFDQWHILSAQNEIIDEINSDHITLINKKWLCIERNGILLLKNLEKKDSVNIQGRYAGSNKRTIGLSRNKSFQLFDLERQTLIPEKFDSIYFAGNYIFTARKKQQLWYWEIRDEAGSSVSEEIYEGISISEDYLIVKKQGFYGLLDMQLEEQLPAIYDQIIPASVQSFLVQYQSMWGVIAHDNSWLINPNYLKLHEVESGFFLGHDKFLHNKLYQHDSLIYSSMNHLKYAAIGLLTEEDQMRKKRVISLDGSELIPYSEWSHRSFGRHILVLQKQNSLHILSLQKKWNFKLEKGYEVMSADGEDFLMIKKDGKYGFVDGLGNLRIANRYDEARDFRNDRAAVKIAGRWGFINHAEELVIQPLYAYVSGFSQQRAVVRGMNEKYGLIDIHGNLVINHEYDSVAFNSHGKLLLFQNNKVGLANIQGQILLHPKYDELTDDGNGYVRVKRGDAFGLLTEKGMNTIPVMYDELLYDNSSNYYFARTRAHWELKYKSDLKP